MTLEFQNVSFEYRKGQPVLSDLSFSTSTEDLLLIIGQNGVGKSTLLKLLNGILKPTAGRVTVGDLDTSTHSIARLAGEICVTFQNPADQIFAPSVRKEIEFAPRNLKRENVDTLVEEALTLCDLAKVSSHHPYDLPAAQRKLLTVASAIASGTPFLAFDEPSAGLSQIERTVFENLLAKLRQGKRGLVVVSHDLGFFLRYATKVLILAERRLLFSGDPAIVLEQDGLLQQAGLQLPLPLRLARILGM